MGCNGTIFRKYITDENCSIEHKTEKKKTIPQMVYSVPPENGTTLTLAFHKKKKNNNNKKLKRKKIPQMVYNISDWATWGEVELFTDSNFAEKKCHY